MITKGKAAVLMLAGIGLLNLSVHLRSALPWPSAVVTFLCLFLLPGLLLLPVLGIKKRNDLVLYIYYAVALSIAYLMVLGLLINTVLPIYGIDHPLRIDSVLPAVNVTLLLSLAAWLRVKPFSWAPKLPSWRQFWTALMPSLWVLCAVAGAHGLNNGASNWFTILALLGVLGTFIYDFLRADTLPRATIAIHIFTAALALLLMTSLRGWLVTGHDIQREFYVFQLAKAQWHWEISSFRDPYNACLSITVLPTMLAGLMRIPDSYIYKLFFQVLFALCPVAVYLISRRLANRRLAILATLYFVAFPTFFMDMPMLNRQEIAFLFFAGMLLLVKDSAQHYKSRLLLFGCFGAGVTLAHYSTTYSTLLIFGGAMVLCMLFEQKWLAHIARQFFTAVKRPAPEFIGRHRKRSLMVIPIMGALVAMALVWNVQVTGTSRGLYDTFRHALGSISGNIEKDIKSSDTQVSLVGGSKTTLESKVAGYVQQQDADRQLIKDQDTYYPLSETQKTPIVAAPEEPLPATALGETLAKDGVNLYTAHYTLRQTSAKVLQVLVILGIFVLFFSKRHSFKMNAELTALTLTSMIFLLLLVLVPVLSVNYGLLRAFQQVLILLGLPMILGSIILFSRFSDRISALFALVIASCFYLSTTGLLAEATGGYLAQLHLHNRGLYYDSYYIHDGEISAVRWLSAYNPPEREPVLQTDLGVERFTAAQSGVLASYDSVTGVYPGLVQKETYVFLGYTNVNRHVAYTLHNSEGITYRYPVQFLDGNKNLIYSSSQARVYR